MDKFTQIETENVKLKGTRDRSTSTSFLDVQTDHEELKTELQAPLLKPEIKEKKQTEMKKIMLTNVKVKSDGSISPGLQDTLAYHEKLISELQSLHLKPGNETPSEMEIAKMNEGKVNRDGSTSPCFRDVQAYHEKLSLELNATPPKLPIKGKKPNFGRSNSEIVQGALAYHENLIAKPQAPNTLPRIKVTKQFEMEKDKLTENSDGSTSSCFQDVPAYPEKLTLELKATSPTVPFRRTRQFEMEKDKLKKDSDGSSSTWFRDLPANHENPTLELKISPPEVPIKKTEQIKMEEVRLNFLLMGKTGDGKSATGNTMLNRKFFETSSNSTSETKHVDLSFGQWGRYVLMVVDGPGLMDTDMSRAEDTETAAKNMDEALAMCYGGVDAFLLVIKSGNRFTKENRLTLETLQHLFGPTYLNHVIVVMTGGDTFQGSLKEDRGECVGFHDWCKKQDGDIQTLYEDCKGRFVLLNNRVKSKTENEAQVTEIIRIAHELQTHNGRYTSQCFKAAEAGREKLILEHRAPQLIREIQEKNSLLVADIEAYSEHQLENGKQKIWKRAQALSDEIYIQDKNFGVLQEMRELAQTVEDRVKKNVEEEQGKKVENARLATELQDLSKKLENSRKGKRVWSSIGSVCACVAGTIILVAAAPVALVVGGVAAIAAAGYVARAVK